jgi:predicted acyl esterase
VLVEKDVPMQTRDGVTLRADDHAPWVFQYCSACRIKFCTRPGDIDYFVERGYGVIMQDTCGSASGESIILIWEMGWLRCRGMAAKLPWSDGNVGTMGQSYRGHAALLAPGRPPHLKAAFPVSAATDFQQCWVYHTGGAFELGWQIPYAIFMARDSLERQGLKGQLLATLERDLVPAPTPFAQPLSDEAYRRLPLMAWGELLRPVARYLTDYLQHPEDGPYWWAINLERQHANISVPMYH